MQRHSSYLIISVLVLVILLGAGCQKTTLPAAKSPEQAVDLAHKTLGQLTGTEKTGITFEKTAQLNEEVPFEFRLRDYKDVPKDVQSFEGIEKALITLTGKATIKVKKFGSQDKLKLTEAKQGKTYYYALYDFKGSSTNPKGNSIQPTVLGQTGWDPAPALVLIIDGQEKVSSNPLFLLQALNIPIDYHHELTRDDWISYAGQWQADKGLQPVLAIKYYDPQGNKKYIKIEY